MYINIQKFWFIPSILSMLVIIGCSNSGGSSPDNQAINDIKDLRQVIQSQSDKLNYIELELKEHEGLINDQAEVMSVYENNNKNVIEFRSELKKEFKSVIENFKNPAFEKEVTNSLIKVQNKIEILEDRTFYTDSLYFEIVNELVMIENKIESLIASNKEITELSVKKKNKSIPKITDEEYQTKYIEALSSYQNTEWSQSLDLFKYLIEANGGHELADNCQYWIGEVYYSLKDFNRSIKEFEKVFTFPGTNKADDAQFKLGLCYINNGQPNKAKIEFESLIEFYPNSEYYKRSQEYLNKF